MKQKLTDWGNYFISLSTLWILTSFATGLWKDNNTDPTTKYGNVWDSLFHSLLKVRFNSHSRYRVMTVSNTVADFESQASSISTNWATCTPSQIKDAVKMRQCRGDCCSWAFLIRIRAQVLAALVHPGTPLSSAITITVQTLIVCFHQLLDSMCSLIVCSHQSFDSLFSLQCDATHNLCSAAVDGLRLGVYSLGSVRKTFPIVRAIGDNHSGYACQCTYV